VTLAETQALFHRLLTQGPEADPAGLEACFAGTPELPAAERVGIYAGMFRWRQVEALGEEFPRLAALLGPERFPSLCHAYLEEHPSAHHDIGKLGRRLADFLSRHPDPERPDLASLAELEWARSEAFGAAEAGAEGAGALAGLAPGAFAGARLRLAPSLRLLALDWDAAALWRALEPGPSGSPGPEPGPPLPGPAAVAVWRSGHEVVHAPIDPAEAGALRAALAGEPLGAVCAAFEGLEDPAASAHAALASWLAEGWVAGVEPPGAA
jgi:hypothetical protein